MKDDGISASQVAHAEIARGKLLRLQAYLEKGRRLESLSDDELDKVWISTFREWSKDLRLRPAAHDDADAEIELRGRQAPYDAVKEEFKGLMAAADAAYAKMSDELKQKVNDEMYEKYEADKKHEN